MKFSTSLDERFDLEFTVDGVTEKYKVRPLGGGELMDAMEIQSKLSRSDTETETIVESVKQLFALILEHVEDAQDSYKNHIKNVFPRMAIAEQNRFIAFIIEQSETSGQETTTPDKSKLEDAVKAIEAQRKAKSDS